jgi:proteasome lid subunit RPN8/RPN11
MQLESEKTMLSTKLVLTKSVHCSISNLLKVDNLIEQVGILFGTKTRREIRLEFFVEMENLDSSPNSFSIDYGILAKFIQKYQEIDKDLLGFFHSHPSGSLLFPSKIDLSFMKLWPFPHIWLIGAYPTKLDAFTYLENKVKPIPFNIIP